MSKKLKALSLLLFFLSLLNIGLSYYLLSLDWFQWRISTDDVARAGYRIEVVSEIYDEIIYEQVFPHGNIEVWSPKGKCYHLDVRWLISDSEIIKQDRISGSFFWGHIFSFFVALVSLVNFLWRWWDNKFLITFLPLGICLIVIAIMRVLGPINNPGSIDVSMYDFDCTYLVPVQAELVSINQSASNVFGIIIFSELAIVTTVYASLLKEY